MINQKQKIIATVNTLPEVTTWDDATYTLYLHSKLQKSQDDIKNGRVITLEDFDKEREALYESYSIKRSKTRHE